MKIGQFIKNFFSDKGERAVDCFKYLQSKGITLCNEKTGAQIKDTNQAEGIGIPRVTIDNSNLSGYCHEAFAEKGCIDCNKVLISDTLTDGLTASSDQL